MVVLDRLNQGDIPQLFLVVLKFKQILRLAFKWYFKCDQAIRLR